MQSTSTSTSTRGDPAWRGLLAILALAVLCMSVGAAYDQELTLALRGWGGAEFASVMGRSLFEGDAPGAGDIGTVAQIAAILLYLWTALSGRESRRSLRPILGFMTFSALSVSTLVHAFKVMLARPRPGGVFGPFWEPSMAVPEKLFGTGSFPSGHTAQVALLLAFVYAWSGASPVVRRIAAAVVLAFAATMGLSRIVSFKHWLTDTIGSVFLCWVALHCSYYYVLRVPEQRVYLERWGKLPSRLARLWELELFGWVLLGAASAAASAALWRSGQAPLAILPALVVPAAAVAFVKRRRRCLATLGAAPE